MYPGVLLANSVLGLPHEEVTLGKLELGEREGGQRIC